ncbi:hypothetical protein SDJN03_06970, partial [Cucurbita argyrosperma subsp. sororia]
MRTKICDSHPIERGIEVHRNGRQSLSKQSGLALGSVTIPLRTGFLISTVEFPQFQYLGKGLRQGRKTTKEKEPNKNGEQARPTIVTETTSTSELQARAGEGVKVALLRLSLPQTVKIPSTASTSGLGAFFDYQTNTRKGRCQECHRGHKVSNSLTYSDRSVNSWGLDQGRSARKLKASGSCLAQSARSTPSLPHIPSYLREQRKGKERKGKGIRLSIECDCTYPCFLRSGRIGTLKSHVLLNP